MMGLHQNYSLSWGPERLEGCLELDFEGMLSPLPTEVAPSRVSGHCWSLIEPAQNEQQPMHGASRNHPLTLPDLDSDPTILLPNICQRERDLRYLQAEEHHMVNPKIERLETMPKPHPARSSPPTNLSFPQEEEIQSWTAMELAGKELRLFDRVGFQSAPEFFETSRCVGHGHPVKQISCLPADSILARQHGRPVKQNSFLPADSILARQQLGEIFGDGTDTDDDFLFEDLDEDAIVPTDICVEKSYGQQPGVFSQALPLRLIKHQVRSRSRDEEEVYDLEHAYDPEDLTYYDSEELELEAIDKKPQLAHLKRPMDLSQAPIVKEPKRARGNRQWVQPQVILSDSPSKQEDLDDSLKLALIAVNEARTENMSGRDAPQMNSEKPPIDVNHAIREMPEDTAQAFKELFRLVGAAPKSPSLPGDEIEDSPELTLSDTQARSAVEHFDEIPLVCAMQVSHLSPSDKYEKHIDKKQGPYSPHGLDSAGKRSSCGDVVVFEPKPEPPDMRKEVKQENQPHAVAVRPVEECGLTTFNKDRHLILTALNTFELCRRHIMRYPTYGRPTTDVTNASTSNKRLRADLKAACVMRKKGYWLNEAERPIGEVKGVAVGDRFRYRIEMAVIGLHRAVQAGIAVVPRSHSPYGVPVASSVVLGVSDPYQDDSDMGDTVVYSGQGGLCGKTKEARDQELKRGNLALSNTFQLNLPVRLIRGHRDQQSSGTGVVYSYDGLYRITEMNYAPGVTGKKVYKFTMQRVPGQVPILDWYPSPVASQSPALEDAYNSICWKQAQ